MTIAVAFAYTTNPGIFSEKASVSQEISREDVYTKLDMGMSKADAQMILSNAGYTDTCTKSTSTEGKKEECAYWRFSWQDNDVIAVFYIDGKVSEIKQVTSDNSNYYSNSMMES